jgi:hypothetical protein
MTINKPTVPKPTKPQGHLMTIVRWPAERRSEGIGLSVKDGWNFSIGFGLAMAIAVPLILLLIGCALMFALTLLGGSLGALL